MDRKNSLKRWRDYFEEISTVEFPHPAIPSTAPTHGPVQKITVEEIEAALKKMRPGKATGPDDVAADLWKSKYWYPAEWLAKFFNQVVAEKKKFGVAPIAENMREARLRWYSHVLRGKEDSVRNIGPNFEVFTLIYAGWGKVASHQNSGPRYDAGQTLKKKKKKK
ncbi:unnamed protein product [Heligmosomoides polygyrus]|uniref:DUF1738 domain-containing protein n=1 Tax=Heligmosomoides polygyrus TaxID=6339 RepID=A0A183GDF1_HELPZ|nr:unnamed protein product [Heligmosomoides polygyrus]